MMQPRFRQDLVAEPIEDGGNRFIDVADPDNGHVFRFYEVEYSLACAMDGERDVAGIVRWAQEELGLATNTKEVSVVIATLGDLGFIEVGAVGAVGARAAAAAVEAKPIEVKPAAPPPAARPTPAVAKPVDLGAGVVVPKSKAPAKPVAEVELGAAGSTIQAKEDLPKSADLELGSPGSAAPAMREQTTVDDIPLGVAGRTSEPVIERHTESDVDSDVSLDLADHLAVKPADVKEAVRASQVMRSVDVPPELESALDSAAEETREPPRSEPVRHAPQPEPVRHAPQAEPVRHAQPAPVRAPQPMPQPIAAGTEPKRPVAPAPQRAISPVLVFLLVVVVLGAAAFVTYKFVLQKSERTEQSSAKPAPPAPAPAPAPAPKPPAPAMETQKLVTEQPPVDEVKAAMAAPIETLAADGAQVKQGEAVAKLAGYKPIETEMLALAHDIDSRVAVELANAEKERDAAQAAGNKAGVTAAEAKIADRKRSIDDKRGKLAAQKAELEKYIIAAPDDGTVQLVAKAGARVGVGDVVAKIARPAVLVATFKTPQVGDRAGIVGSRAWIVVKSTGAKVSCKIVSSDIKVACPHDTASESAEAVFAGLDKTAPKSPATAEIEMTDEPSGSAAHPAPAPAAPAH
ncbi:MAG TPA: hypothetical protein VMJ10_07330 [Kofleriaceae bacterium]|nr:hypothetical protein [Kofleriaceae bacterium]